jgi:molybdate transport system ATP-binding protein
MIAVDLKKRLGDFSLEIAFETADRGITALFGRSGAGKTMLVNMMAGLLKPDEGVIRVGERVLFDSQARVNIRPERRRVGYVFQESRLFPHLSVKSNLFYGRRFAPKGARYHDPAHIVDLLGLEGLLARRPATLSGGEKQRVAIGRALLAEPSLLLMDEPLAALDAARKSEIMGYIERLRDALGVPIVYVSHALDEVTRLADQVVLLADGRLVAAGPAVEIMGRPDLSPHTGRHEAGALIESRVAGHDDFGLTELAFAGGTLRVSGLDLEPGTKVRVRIRARDVAIATARPADLSILNVFAGRVVEMHESGPAAMDLALDIGVPLWARITRRSARELGLAPGREVFALVKSVAIDRHSLGLARPPRRD